MGTPVEELTGLPCTVVWVIHAAGSPANREKGLVFTHPGAMGRSPFPNWLAAVLGTCRGKTLPWLPLSSFWVALARHKATQQHIFLLFLPLQQIKFFTLLFIFTSLLILEQ